MLIGDSAVRTSRRTALGRLATASRLPKCLNRLALLVGAQVVSPPRAGSIRAPTQCSMKHATTAVVEAQTRHDGEPRRTPMLKQAPHDAQLDRRH